MGDWQGKDSYFCHKLTPLDGLIVLDTDASRCWVTRAVEKLGTHNHRIQGIVVPTTVSCLGEARIILKHGPLMAIWVLSTEPVTS